MSAFVNTSENLGFFYFTPFALMQVNYQNM